MIIAYLIIHCFDT